MALKVLKWLAGGLLSILLLVLLVYVASGARQPPANSASASWLGPGLHAVGQTDITFVDDSRPTDENRGNPGAASRTLVSTLWYPRNTEGPHPLIVHSHGILSTRSEMSYVAEALASSGYVVIAADYPLTNGATPGGANASDVVNQPGDVSFLIDSVLALSGDSKPFTGEIDGDRIGLTGLSLGGLTTTLATYHPRWRDPRIKAAVSIAGPSAAFTERFYTTTEVPFLMIAGTADALIDHASNAAVIPERIDNGALLSISGGSHLGFIGISDPLFRFMHNPDSLGCAGVLEVLEDPDGVFLSMGSEAEGVRIDPDAAGVCASLPPQEASHPGRQQMITEIGVLAFFESVFGSNEDERSAAAEQLRISLAEDFSEASYFD